MKYKTTAKEVRENSYNLKYASYCEIQNLLYFESPAAYTCGVYGWNFDVYDLPGMTLTTGYRNLQGKHVTGGREYDNAARDIIYNYDLSYEERRDKVTALLYDFIKLNGGN